MHARTFASFIRARSRARYSVHLIIINNPTPRAQARGTSSSFISRLYLDTSFLDGDKTGRFLLAERPLRALISVVGVGAAFRWSRWPVQPAGNKWGGAKSVSFDKCTVHTVVGERKRERARARRRQEIIRTNDNATVNTRETIKAPTRSERASVNSRARLLSPLASAQMVYHRRNGRRVDNKRVKPDGHAHIALAR